MFLNVLAHVYSKYFIEKYVSCPFLHKTYWPRYALIVLCIWTTNSKTIISYLLKKHAAYLTFQVDYLIKYVLSGFGTPWG